MNKQKSVKMSSMYKVTIHLFGFQATMIVQWRTVTLCVSIKIFSKNNSSMIIFFTNYNYNFIAAKQLTIQYMVWFLDVTGDEFQNMRYVCSAVWSPCGIESSIWGCHWQWICTQGAQWMPIQNLGQYPPHIHVLRVFQTQKRKLTKKLENNCP